jgi:uncharacterized protein YbjT (DUF2867 family)
MTATIGVIGGSGFIGTHLVNRLYQSGYRIRVLTRRRETHKHLLVIPSVELIKSDLYDPRRLEEDLDGCSAVINLVGILNEPGRHGIGFMRAHVELPRLIVRACQERGIRRLLHMSALRADARRGTSHYLRTKGEGEDLVHAAAGPDFQVTSFQPSVVFGPEDDFFNRFAKLLKIAPYWFPLACAQTRFAPVYVADVVEAMVRTLDDAHSHGQRYQLCGPKSYSLGELVAYTAQVVGVRRRVIKLPQWAAYLQAAILEWLPGKPFSRDNYGSLQVDSVCDAGPGLQSLGIQPTAVETVVPGYLRGSNRNRRYQQFRRAAGGG